MSLVSFVKTENDESSSVRQAIQHSLDIIGYHFSKDIQNVAIKPNLCYYWDYSTGETTDPRFVETLIHLLRSQVSPSISVSIVESDASAMRCKYAFKILGYEKMARRCGATLVNLSKDEYENAEVTVGDESFHFRIPRTISDADLRVNVPKIKYMEGTKISCALKNIYGCNPYPKKFRYHRKLDETIVALNKVMKFDLCVVDGIIVSGARPRRLGLVMAGCDPVAVDAAAAGIAGLNAKSIRHIVLASREGLGNASFIPKGIATQYFRERYPQKTMSDRIMGLGFKLVCALGLQTRLGL